MKLASIELLHDLRPHPNADKLELAKVLEWPVVVKKGEYKEGDKVIFIYPDTVAPQTEYFKFLEPKKYRVNKIRLRKELSYGLVCPLAAFTFDESPYNLDIGTDISNTIGVTKYEKPIDPSINGEAKSNFPTSIISITDEDNFLSNKACEREFAGLDCVAQLKMDGSSGTLIYLNGEIKVCSRRLELKEGNNAWWNILNKYDLINKVKTLGFDVAIQFEVCGPKINGNELRLSDFDLFVFNIKNLNTGTFYGINDILKICNLLGVKTPPTIAEFNYDGVNWNLDKLRQVANSVTYPAGNPGEGIVIRPVNPVFSNILAKMLSVKIINENYID